MTQNLRHVLVLVLLLCAGGTLAASKTDYPNRPVRYIVPFPPGGATDIVARIVANTLTEELGKQVVIDNRSGAAGTLGAEIAARAAPRRASARRRSSRWSSSG